MPRNRDPFVRKEACRIFACLSYLADHRVLHNQRLAVYTVKDQDKTYNYLSMTGLASNRLNAVRRTGDVPNIRSMKGWTKLCNSSWTETGNSA